MAVLSVKPVPMPLSGSAESKKRSYQRTFVVLTDDVNDGPITIRSHADVPKIYDTYNFGGSEVDAFAYCVSVDVQPRDGGRLPTEDSPDAGKWAWTVTAKYEAEGDTSENPLLKPAILSFDTEQYDAVFERDVDGNPVWNSARQAFDPPPIREDNHWMVRIEKNLPDFDFAFADSYQNTVNEDTFLGAAPGTLRIKSIKAREEHNDTIGMYFSCSVEMQYRRIEFGGHEPHQLYVLDQGRYMRIAITSGNRPNSGFHLPILDRNKPPQPVHDPVPLDGAGAPLGPSASPVYLFFRRYLSSNFSAMGIYP